jgi:hypothetical protein
MTENIESNIVVTKRKNKLGAGRPVKYEEGAKQHEKTSKYHQQYYHLTNKIINCDICGKVSTMRSIVMHKQSMKCQFIKMTKLDGNLDVEIPIENL